MCNRVSIDHTLPVISSELLEALTASISALDESTTDQHSRQSFIDDTLGDATSNQKARPERADKHTTYALTEGEPTDYVSSPLAPPLCTHIDSCLSSSTQTFYAF